MPTQVVMPKLSPTMEEGQLARWLKKEGDKVSIGEPIAEIDTDKATMEMQALASGVLRKIIVHEGESVPLGQIIAVIGEPDEDISGMLDKAGAAKPTAPSTNDTGNGAAAQATTATSAPSAESAENRAAVKSEYPVSQDLTTAYPPAESRGDESDGRRIIVSPLAARMAADAGINLRTMQGSGPGGRIVKRDIESAVADAKSQHVAAPTTSQVTRPTAPVQLPEIAEASPFRDEPTTEMRRTIARRLVTSIGPVPHFFLTTEIEMDKAAEFRSSLAQIDPSLKVSFNDIVIKVVANCLIKHPAVNASFQDRSIRYYERADIGVAVAVEDGLITPIIRSADKKSIVEIGAEIKEKAERARTRKLRPEEYLGATFSVSNLGMFGIDEFTAIINPPEAAILAVGAIKPIPVVRNNEIVVRQMMHVTMSCDHRVVDGATGAKFLQTVKRTLENPLLLLV
jgi:pyruvate dehydrogenase E2 component (dihydrolipoamide acetyltransferase)